VTGVATGVGRSGSVRAPQASGEALVEPPFGAAPQLVAENRQRLSQRDYDLHGRPLLELARQARRELVEQAYAWSCTYRDVERPSWDPERIVLVAGHQPELFHPGVWFKNLALARLASRVGAVAVNLLIDTDAARRTAILVPHGTPARPRVTPIAMDEATPAVPYEERRVIRRDLFESFGQRVEEQIASLVPDPLIRRYWSVACGRARETGNLGAAVAQARHWMEGQWGFSTLEIPESRVCASEPFRWFLAHVLAELPRFRRVYNQALREYRREHRIRNVAHPAAELSCVGQWLEAPFWIWSADDPRRRRLFVRRGPDGVVLSDRERLEVELPARGDQDASDAVEELSRLEGRGIKIRCRALVTTLWARLALGDVFLHGIGGARYDQVTDRLVTDFFGFCPPRFLVLSATFHLPVRCPRRTVADVRAIDHRLRELTWHPELYVDAQGGPQGREAAPLVEAKRRWIAVEPTSRREARRRFLEIRRINQQLQPWVAGQRQRLLAERAETVAALEAQRILSWREYAFCLFPEPMLRSGLEALLPDPGPRQPGG